MGPTQEDLCYRTTRWQRLLYDEERQQTKQLAMNERNGEQRGDRFADFQREVFARLYNPSTPKLDEPVEGTEWAQAAHEQASALREFGALQERCKGDEMWAGMATAAVVQQVLHAIAPRTSNANLAALRARVDGMEELTKKGLVKPERLRKAREALEQGLAEAEAAAKGTDASALRNALRKGCEKAQQALSEVDKQVDAFSYGDGIGATQSGADMQTKRELAKKIGGSSKLQQIAELAGRMRRIAAQKQRSKASYARDEIASIETGADVQRLLPSELALLGGGEELEALFYSRLAESKCTQYALKGKEKEGRGPIIVCCDESGSMEGAPEAWAKAVALALLDVARKQKRSWLFIHFDSKVSRVDKVEKGQVDGKAVMQCMEHFTGGGTSFWEPLQKAIECIRSDGGFKQADVLFITDGVAPLTEGQVAGTKAMLADLEASLYSVLVNTSSAGSIEQVSTKTFQLHELLAQNSASEERFADTVFAV